MAQDVRPGISDELEKQLVEQCSVTLASLKSASLFRTNVPSTLLAEWIAQWNERLCDKGVSLCVLWGDENASLVYVCRRSHLQSDLNAPGVTRFLRAYGFLEPGIIQYLHVGVELIYLTEVIVQRIQGLAVALREIERGNESVVDSVHAVDGGSVDDKCFHGLFLSV